MSLALGCGEETAIDPVLAAALTHLWFVTVHPFDDGNGRIARAIADMALARSEGSPQRFYSMSSQTRAERIDYYATLASAQKSDVDVTAWIEWFLACLDNVRWSIDCSTDSTASSRRRAWSSGQRERGGTQHLLCAAQPPTRVAGEYLGTSRPATIAPVPRRPGRPR
jgi:Fic family protein